MRYSTYNLKDLSNELATTFDLTQARGAQMTRFVFDRIAAELAQGTQVRLHRFGTLTARVRAAGVARNPMTGERVEVPSRRVVRFNVSPELKRGVNGKSR